MLLSTSQINLSSNLCRQNLALPHLVVHVKTKKDKMICVAPRLQSDQRRQRRASTVCSPCVHSVRLRVPSDRLGDKHVVETFLFVTVRRDTKNSKAKNFKVKYYLEPNAHEREQRVQFEILKRQRVDGPKNQRMRVMATVCNCF